MTEIQQAMAWLLSGSTGLSSECIMATLLCGEKVSRAGQKRVSVNLDDL